MTALYTVQDHLPRPEDALRHSASETKGGAAYEAVTEARAEQLKAKRIYDQQRSELSDDEANSKRATGNVFEKAKALERHVNTDTMRAESLAMTHVEHLNTQAEQWMNEPISRRIRKKRFCIPVSVLLDFSEKSTPGQKLQFLLCVVLDKVASTCVFGRGGGCSSAKSSPSSSLPFFFLFLSGSAPSHSFPHPDREQAHFHPKFMYLFFFGGGEEREGGIN